MSNLTEVLENEDRATVEDIIAESTTFAFVKWVAPGAVSWTKNSLTRDGLWTMIANKDTVERPAPQDDGPIQDSLDRGAVTTNRSQNAVVNMIHDLSFKEAGWVKTIYVKSIFSDLDTYNRVTIENIDTGETSVHDNLILPAGSYYAISAPNHVVGIGANFRISFKEYNSSSAAEIHGGWTSDLVSGVVEPASGKFTINSLTNPTTMTYHHTDLDGDSRATELDGVVVDSLIEISETGDVNRSIELKVTAVNTDSLTSTQYSVTVVGNGSKDIRDNKTCTHSINVPITKDTDFASIVGHYATQPAFVDVTTALEFDGVDQGAPVTDAYPISVEFQKAYISPDWDIVSHSSQG